MSKISEFNNLLAPTESAVLPVVDNAETRKITLANLRKSLFVPASDSEFGVIKIGNNLSIDQNGVLSAADPTVTADWTATTGPSVILNKPVLSTVAITNAYNDLNGRPNIPPAQIQSDWDQSDELQRDFIKNKPFVPSPQIQTDWAETDILQLSFIRNKPFIPAAQVNSDWTATSGISRILNKPVLFSGNYADLTGKPALATVATSGSYTDLSNKPVIPTVTTEYVDNAPASSIGQVGDVPGMVFATSLFVYVCFGVYDGVSNIWAKSATVSATW
jgi:hypothetical protein